MDSNDITLCDGTDDGKKPGDSSDVRIVRLKGLLKKEKAKTARLGDALKEEYYRSTKLAYELKEARNASLKSTGDEVDNTSSDSDDVVRNPR